jgi:legumain
MQYGSLDLGPQHLFTYIGSNPANDNATFVEDNSLPSFSKAVNQRDADLVYFWQKVSTPSILEIMSFQTVQVNYK